MALKRYALPASVWAMAACIQIGVAPLHAAALAAALEGSVSSREEGPMEGVLVSAKRAGGNVTVTVVSDEQGRYRFPAGRLTPGKYAIRIRAAKYELDGAGSASVARGKTARADLKLKQTSDPSKIAAQISNAEWIMSFPGTEQQRASVGPCTHCHTLERVARSKYDADAFVPLIDRMLSYPSGAFPKRVNTGRAPKLLDANADPAAEAAAQAKQQAARRQLAEYLASINLSTTDQWKYEFKTYPRPKGKATQVIYTEWTLPNEAEQPHDVIVDSRGLVWYADFGSQLLGVLDPKTGKVTEYTPPTLKKARPGGSLSLHFDKDENLWLGMMWQGGIAKFDRNTRKFKTWSLPDEIQGDHVQLTFLSPDNLQVDNKVWVNDSGTYNQYRVDVMTGKWETFETSKAPHPGVYDIISDKQNNLYFNVIGREHIGRIDAKTKQVLFFEIPTKGAGPRRGMMDAQGRLWFGENRADKIGVFDTNTQKFQEWVPPTKGSWPYDVTADKNGMVWSGGEFTDRVLRLDPRSGEFTEYLLPRDTNVRRLWTDRAPNPALWVGSTHNASIIKLEVLDAPAGSGSR